MSHWKNTLLFVGIGVTIALAAVGVEAAQSQTISAPQIGVVVGALISLLAVALRKPDATQLEAENQATQQALSETTEDMKKQRDELTAFRAELEDALETRAKRLDAREVELDNRLITFHEWLEYPIAQTAEAADSDPAEVTPGELAEESPAELNEKDQQLHDLLETEASSLYEKLKEGAYKGDDGKFDPEKARADVVDFVVRVAKIYRPDSDHPLLETSIEQLLRAGSRTCLHLLILLERMPLNLKEANFATVHSHLTTAVKAYDVYRSAEPWVGYASKALYGVRMAAGVNPVTLGLTWALTELGKAGVKHAAKKFVDHQAVALLHDLVRVVGFEVAAIYSGDFRYRDANWIYASELTALMSRFPVSRESLAHALREIGSLPMRNEYDRVFLYRCLSTHKQPRPLIDARETISQSERMEVGKKLERFFRTFVHGKTRSRAEDWLNDLESRIGVRLSIPELEHQPDETLSTDSDRRRAARSLAGFLIGVKATSLSTMQDKLSSCQTLSGLDGDLEGILSELPADPLQFFEPPDVDTESDVLDSYFEDLIDFAVQTPPHDVQADDLILETASYFGRDLKKTQGEIDRHYVELVTGPFAENAPTRKIEPVVARLIAGALIEQETAQFVYAGVTVNPTTDSSSFVADSGTVWLTATTERLLLLSDRLGVMAESKAGQLATEKIDGMVIDDCRLDGTWKLADGRDARLSVTVKGAVVTRYDAYFDVLLSAISSGQ